MCLQATRQGQASFAHVHEIIAGLRKRGWQVDLFEPSYARSIADPPSVWKLVAFLRVQLRLICALRCTRYDALYVRHHPFDALSIRASKKLKIPLVVEVNGSYEDLYMAFPMMRPMRWIGNSIMRYGIREADVVITVTEPLVNWALQERGGQPVILISNGANTDLFHPDAPGRLPGTIPTPYAIFFGALAPWQGIETLIDTLHRSNWPPQLHLLIVGKGKLRDKVEKATRQTNRIVYIDHVPYQQMPVVVRHSLCGLAPMHCIERNQTGVMPLKVFETLACGVPVIVSDLPGMSDLVRRGNCGLVVPPNNPVALANAVRYLYEHPEVRAEMGKRGRELIVREHSWDSRAEATHQILLQVLAK
ncbi:MAG: glycosyl transferase [Patescibacteria group bacterium]|nr:MAG: glycosyl transferase [Patescibacteria group bacterium]